MDCSDELTRELINKLRQEYASFKEAEPTMLLAADYIQELEDEMQALRNELWRAWDEARPAEIENKPMPQLGPDELPF